MSKKYFQITATDNRLTFQEFTLNSNPLIFQVFVYCCFCKAEERWTFRTAQDPRCFDCSYQWPSLLQHWLRHFKNVSSHKTPLYYWMTKQHKLTTQIVVVKFSEYVTCHRKPINFSASESWWKEFSYFRLEADAVCKRVSLFTTCLRSHPSI